MLKNIYVLYGGISVEHEVSIRSGKTIIQHLNRDKYEVHPVYIDKKGVWHPQGITGTDITEEDIVKTKESTITDSIASFLTKDFDSSRKCIFFPILHGTGGEDGTIQGFLKTLNVPFTGNSVLSSSSTMDKGVANDLLEAHKIPQAKYVVLNRWDYQSIEDIHIKEIADYLGYPLYVKPCNAGSSVGITPVKKEEDFQKALELAFKYDKRIVLEEEIKGTELEITVLGNKKTRSTVAGSYVSSDAFLDYESKYHDSTVKAVMPYPLEEEKLKELRALAEKAYKACNCMGFARVDIFMRDGDEALLVNEINTLPGMTVTSMAPKLWELTHGDAYPEFFDLLISLAEQAYEERNSLFKDKDRS